MWAGSTKIAAPIVMLKMAAASPRTPMTRRRPGSVEAMESAPRHERAAGILRANQRVDARGDDDRPWDEVRPNLLLHFFDIAVRLLREPAPHVPQRDVADQADHPAFVQRLDLGRRVSSGPSRAPKHVAACSGTGIGIIGLCLFAQLIAIP